MGGWDEGQHRPRNPIATPSQECEKVRTSAGKSRSNITHATRTQEYHTTEKCEQRRGERGRPSGGRGGKPDTPHTRIGGPAEQARSAVRARKGETQKVS